MTFLKKYDIKNQTLSNGKLKREISWKIQETEKIMRTVETMVQMQGTQGRALEAMTEKKARTKVIFSLSRQKNQV